MDFFIAWCLLTILGILLLNQVHTFKCFLELERKIDQLSKRIGE